MMIECCGNYRMRDLFSFSQLGMKEMLRSLKHTAQVFLLEEWYEADREERKESVRRMEWRGDLCALPTAKLLI